jgi:FkbM family methyltransferase
MIDFIWLIKDLFACSFDLQQWVNHRYKDPNIVFVRRDTTDHIVTTEGLKFGLEGCEEMGDLMTEYRFEDIRPDDIVLDLGANVGGFAIRAAQKAKHVYAVEPLFYKELEENIARNGMGDKITVFRTAIGNGQTIKLKYRDHESLVETRSLKQIREMIPDKVTFLKVDIEGAEWGIFPADFCGIPRIEFEAHGGDNSCMPVDKKLLYFLKDNWRCEETHKKIPYDSFWIHAYPKEGT